MVSKWCYTVGSFAVIIHTKRYNLNVFVIHIFFFKFLYILLAIHPSLKHWYLLFHITSGSRKNPDTLIFNFLVVVSMETSIAKINIIPHFNSFRITGVIFMSIRSREDC